MAANEFFIVGACNVLFILITIILALVPMDENNDFGSTELIAIVSILWCFINAVLAFRFLKSKPNTDASRSVVNKDYLKSSDHSAHIRTPNDGAHKTNRNSDENVVILMKHKDGDARTKTDGVRAENGEIELESIKIKLMEEQEKLTNEHTKRREIEYENKQILDEYKKYKQDNNDTSRDNLILIENCKQLTQQNQELQGNIQAKEEETDALKHQINELEESIHTMEKQIETMQTQIDAGEQLQSDFNALTANSRIVQKQMDEYEERIKELQEKEENMKQQNVRLQQSIEEEEKHKPTEVSNDAASMNAESIEKLKKELAHAQKTIIEMTSVVGVQQKFPTVQETIQQFRSIRDQKHHDASTLLKKFLKSKSDNKWQKYFINQTVHQIMFDILIQCYRYNEEYRLQIYEDIGEILNMKYAIAEAFEIDADEIEGNAIIRNEQMKILSNIFGAYFKTNFKCVLQRRLSSDDEKENGAGLVKDVLAFVMNKHGEYLTDASEEVVNGLSEYAIECSHVCWVMILQDPPLNIKPSTWRNNTDHKEDENEDNEDSYTSDEIVYDEKYHKRVLGSDRNCKNILYYVWPAVARNDVILGDQKIDVILRDALYQRIKEKKKP